MLGCMLKNQNNVDRLAKSCCLDVLECVYICVYFVSLCGCKNEHPTMHTLCHDNVKSAPISLETMTQSTDEDRAFIKCRESSSWLETSRGCTVFKVQHRFFA